MKKIITIIAAFLLFLGLLFVILNLSFGPLLKRQIKSLTHHSVELEYVSSRARLLRGTIELHEAVLSFKNVALDSTSQILIESISFDQFLISHLSLKSLLFDRSFNIDRVLLSGPKIEFLKDTMVNQRELISKILTPDMLSKKSQSAPFSFEVGEIEIEQGSFTLIEAGKNDFSIGNLNLKLQNISMDDLKALNGEDLDLNAQFNIRLGVFNIQKELANDAKISIDSIVYKKDKRLFEVGGIQLNNINNSNSYAESELSVFAGLVSIHGFSLSHFLSSKDMKFDRFLISNTEIYEELNYYDGRKETKQTSASDSISFSSMIKAFITDTLHVQNFNYHSDNSWSDSADYISNLNVWLYSIQVDSNFIASREYLRPLQRSFVVSGPIDMHMPEIGLDVFSDSLAYSGSKKEQTMVGLRVDKYPSIFAKNKDQPTFQFMADSLVISGMDEREWEDSLSLELSLFMKNPILSGSNVFLGKSEKPKKSISSHESIVLNDLNLINGSINISGSAGEKIETEALTIRSEDMEVYISDDPSQDFISWKSLFTSIGFSIFLIPDKILVQLEKGSLNKDKLEFDGILYTNQPVKSQNQNSGGNPDDTSRFYAQQVVFENFNIQALINSKELSIDKLNIEKPGYFQFVKIKQNKPQTKEHYTPLLLYRKINELLPEYFGLIEIGEFRINDGLARYQVEENALAMHVKVGGAIQGLLFDPKNASEGAAQLLADYYEFCISESEILSDKFQIDIDSISYDNDKNILEIVNSHAHNQFLNENSSSKESLSYNIMLPKLVLTEPDFVPIGGGPISFDDFYVLNPDINIYLTAQQGGAKKTDNKHGTLPFTFLENNVILKDGKLNFCIISEGDSSKMHVGSFGLEAKEIYRILGVEQFRTGSKNLFNYLDFDLSDVSFSGPGMDINVNAIDYDKRSGVLSLKPVNQQIYSKPEFPSAKGAKSIIEIPEINIEDPDLIIEKNKVQSLGVRNILIPNVNVAIETDKRKDPDNNPKIRIVDSDSSLRKILGKIEFFHIDSTAINNIGFSYQNLADSAGGIVDIQGVSLIVDELKIDTSHFAFHENRLAKDIILKLHDKEIVTSDSLYLIKVNDVTYYYSKDILVIDSFEVIPRFDREDFFKRVGTQTDLFQMKFESAIAEGIDLISIVESKKLEVEKLTLNRFHLMDHRDKHYARIENDFKKLPKQSLYGLPFVLNVDTIQVNNSFVLYGEYVDKSPEPGEIYFTNFDASIYNVSNFIKKDEKYNSMRADISSDIMDKAKMNVSITMPLAEDDDVFWFSGSVEQTDLTHFNSMTENLFGISIVRGKGGVEIPLINLNDTSSKGSLYFKYKKLKLAMYNRNKAKLSRGLGSGLIDLLMNGILVKSNNPTLLGKTRTGDVYFKRNLERSFFNYLWKSTMSGLMATMGFYNKELRGEKRERKYDEKLERKDERQLNKVK